MTNKRFRFSLRELLILTTAIAALAAEAQALGFSVTGFALLAMLALLIARSLWQRSPVVLQLSVPALVLLIIWSLLPEVQ
jgi:predicted benzoate:H+ symporter BenE